MAYVVHVHCRSANVLAIADLARFIEESMLVEHPAFEPSAGTVAGRASDWTELIIRVERSASIVVRRIGPGAALDEQLRQLRFVLDASRPSRGRERLTYHLASTVQVVSLEASEAIVPEDPSRPSDAWELLCSLEAYVARTLDGVIEAPHPGRSNTFADARRKVFHRL